MGKVEQVKRQVKIVILHGELLRSLNLSSDLKTLKSESGVYLGKNIPSRVKKSEQKPQSKAYLFY